MKPERIKGRIGLFGGTFDPPTIAHLIVAERAADLLKLNRMRFVLNRLNPLKTEVHAAPDNIRLEMLQAAIQGYSRFAVETCELEREGASYTIDTVTHLTQLHPDCEFTLLFGADVLNGFHRWRDPERILEIIRVVVFNRGGYEFNEEAEQWLDRVQILEIPDLIISATSVRDLVRKGRPVNHLVPHTVEEVIKKNGLYL